MTYLFLELKKLLRLPSYRFTYLIIFFILLVKNLLPIFNGDKSKFNWINSLSGSLDLLTFLGVFGMIIVAVQFVSSEYMNRTLQLNISSGITRKQFLFTKALALILGAYIFVFLGILFSILTLAAAALIAGGFSLSNLNNTALLQSFILIPLKLLPMLFLSFFITFITRSSIIPIASLTFYASVGEFVLAYFLGFSFLGQFTNFLPGKVVLPINTITSANLNFIKPNQLPLDSINLPLWASISGILGYAIIFSLISYIIFHEQDLSR